MKKRDRDKTHAIENDSNFGPDLSNEEQDQHDTNLVDQVADKTTGAKPYESDNAVVQAKMRAAACQPKVVNDSIDPAEPSPTAKSPTFTSGGGGIDYEDYVVAYHLTMMLLQRTPLGNKFGAIQRVLWQAEDTGWLFDDVVVCNGNGMQAGISAKTDVHLNSNGFSDDFAKRAWTQYTSISDRTFNSGDLIC